MSRAMIIHCSPISLFGEELMMAKLHFGIFWTQFARKDPKIEKLSPQICAIICLKGTLSMVKNCSKLYWANTDDKQIFNCTVMLRRFVFLRKETQPLYIFPCSIKDFLDFSNLSTELKWELQSKKKF